VVARKSADSKRERVLDKLFPLGWPPGEDSRRVWLE